MVRTRSERIVFYPADAMVLLSIAITVATRNRAANMVCFVGAVVFLVDVVQGLQRIVSILGRDVSPSNNDSKYTREASL